MTRYQDARRVGWVRCPIGLHGAEQTDVDRSMGRVTPAYRKHRPDLLCLLANRYQFNAIAARRTEDQ